MTEIEQLREAGRRAFDAGNVDLARKVAAEIRRLEALAPQEPEAPASPPEDLVYNPSTGQMTTRELLANHMEQTGLSRTGAAVSGAARGASFGTVDELSGVMNAAIPGAGTPQERYAFGREWTRAREDAAREAAPGTFLASEIGGGAATALGYAVPAMAGRGLLGSAATGARVGAAEGVGYGFAEGEGSFQDRAANAAKLGLLGGGIGFATPYAMSAGMAGARAVADPVAGAAASLTNTVRQGRADRALAATLDRAGMSVDDVSRALTGAASDGQSQYRVMDALGAPGQRRASAIVRSGGDGSQEIRNFLDQRQLDQADRVSAAISDAFDGARTAAQTREALDSARGAAADINYNAAREGARPVNLNGAIDEINTALGRDPILGESALRQTEIGRRLESISRQISAGGEQLIDFDRVLNVKQDLGRQISNMQRRGEKVPPEIARVYGQLDSALEASSDAYRRANDKFKRTSDLIDAVDTGAAMARPGQRAEDTVAAVEGMRPGEVRGARVGYGDKLLTQVGSTPATSNAVRPLTTGKRQTEMGILAQNPDQLSRRIGRESDMFETRARATGGSLTADNIEDINDLRAYDVGPVINLLRGNYGEALAQGGRVSANALTGVNDATRQRIAEALMAQDTAALSRAIESINEPQIRRQVMSALIRSGAIRTGERLLSSQ